MNDPFWMFLAIAVLLALVAIAGLLIALLLRRRSPPVQATPEQQHPAYDGDATLVYLKSLSALDDEFLELINTPDAEGWDAVIAEHRNLVTVCQKLAFRAQRIDTEFVDPKALRLSAPYAQFFSDFSALCGEYVGFFSQAQTMENTSVVGVMIEGAIRGIFGDPFGKAQEVEHANSEFERLRLTLAKRADALHGTRHGLVDELDSLVKKLAPKYGWEFESSENEK